METEKAIDLTTLSDCVVHLAIEENLDFWSDMSMEVEGDELINHWENYGKLVVNLRGLFGQKLSTILTYLESEGSWLCLDNESTEDLIDRATKFRNKIIDGLSAK